VAVAVVVAWWLARVDPKGQASGVAERDPSSVDGAIVKTVHPVESGLPVAVPRSSIEASRQVRASARGRIRVGSTPSELHEFRGNGTIDFLFAQGGEFRRVQALVEAGWWTVELASPEGSSSSLLIPLRLALSTSEGLQEAAPLSSTGFPWEDPPSYLEAQWLNEVRMRIVDADDGHELQAVDAYRCFRVPERVEVDLRRRELTASFGDSVSEIGIEEIAASIPGPIVPELPFGETSCDPLFRSAPSPIAFAQPEPSTPVWITAPGYEWKRADAAEDREGELWLHLGRAGELDVRVVPVPPQGLFVRVHERRADEVIVETPVLESVVGSAGNVILRRVPAGDYRVRLERGSPYSIAQEIDRADVQVRAGRRETVILEPFPREEEQGSLFGKVIVPVPLEGMIERVVVRRMGGPRASTGVSMDAASMERSLSTGGEVVLAWKTAELPTGEYLVESAPYPGAVQLTVGPGSNRVELNLTTSMRRLVSFVDGATGDLVELDRVAVLVRPERAPADILAPNRQECWSCGRAPLVQPGNPLVLDLPDGEMSLMVTAKGFGRTVLERRIGRADDTMSFELRRAARIRVSVRDARGRSVPYDSDWLAGLVLSDRAGNDVLVSGLEFRHDGTEGGAPGSILTPYEGECTLRQQDPERPPRVKPATLQAVPGESVVLVLEQRD